MDAQGQCLRATRRPAERYDFAMPYVSKAQRNYFHANRARLEAQGVDVAGWDRETGERPWPERIGRVKKQKLEDDPKGGRQMKHDSGVRRANPKFS
jgi:hypothetical protein